MNDLRLRDWLFCVQHFASYSWSDTGSKWPRPQIEFCQDHVSSIGQHYTNGNKEFERVSKPDICMQEERDMEPKTQRCHEYASHQLRNSPTPIRGPPDNVAVLRSLMLKLLQNNVTCIMWRRMTQGGLWLLRDVRMKLLAPSWQPTPLISESKSGQN
jgi:hypothetical protein